MVTVHIKLTAPHHTTVLTVSVKKKFNYPFFHRHVISVRLSKNLVKDGTLAKSRRFTIHLFQDLNETKSTIPAVLRPTLTNFLIFFFFFLETIRHSTNSKARFFIYNVCTLRIRREKSSYFAQTLLARSFRKLNENFFSIANGIRGAVASTGSTACSLER